MITDRQKFTTTISLYGISSFHFTVGINSKLFFWSVHSVQETSPNVLRRPTRVDNTSDNAIINQSQAANHRRLLSHMTLSLVECRKKTACTQIAEPCEPNTVLWAFHTIQPSDFAYVFIFITPYDSTSVFLFLKLLKQHADIDKNQLPQNDPRKPAALRPSCYTQRWTLSGINWRPTTVASLSH